MSFDLIVSILAAMVRIGTPLALAAYSGLWCERAGVVNVGIEGMMLTSALFSYLVALAVKTAMSADSSADPNFVNTVSLLAGSAVGILSGGVMALLHAVTSIRFKADQIISGTVINILAVGITGFLYQRYLSSNLEPGPGTFPVIRIPLLAQIPVLGEVFFKGQPILYVMLILTLLTHYIMFYTPWGLRTRAVGENPRAADTVGINVYRMRYANVFIGGLIGGIAGLWFTLETVGQFTPLMTNGRGFIGLAAMIFGKWSPFGAFVAAMIFGLADAAQPALQIANPNIPFQFLSMAPYLITMIVLAGAIGRSSPPAADGQPYEK